MVTFNMLGQLEVIEGRHDYAPTAPRVKAVLALLALNVNRVVSTDTLFAELWDDRPPRSAATTLQTYVYQLRRILDSMPQGDRRCAIVTRAPGYVLRSPEGRTDTERFQTLADQGRCLWRQDRVAEAAERLQQALGLWRGGALADINLGPELTIHRAHLCELRLRVLELRIQADARLGRHHELIPELRSLVAEHRLNERLHAQLIDSLGQAGFRAEALQAYQDLRQVLKTELGLEPTPEVQRLQAEVLSGVRGGSLTALLHTG